MQDATDDESVLSLPKTRKSAASATLDAPTNQPLNSSISALFSSTTSLAGSRSASPNGLAPQFFVNGANSPYRSASPLLRDNAGPQHPARTVVARALAPYVAVYASEDTEEFIRSKGIDGGLVELFRPFGEQISGKVTTRDYIGSSKSWQDFGVHFVSIQSIASQAQHLDNIDPSKDLASSSIYSNVTQRKTDGANESTKFRDIELLVERHLEHAEKVSVPGEAFSNLSLSDDDDCSLTTSFHELYIKRTISRLTVNAHETFAHPVSCIIAISSRTQSPIETLRRLYEDISQGENKVPYWISNDFLRYYVLVHDEDSDDIKKSSALFEQMKRHFGLHCHLLRIRSVQSVPTDDDTTRLPLCEWQSASEELDNIRAKEKAEEYDESFSPCIFESDVSAIKTFVREMVTQSIVPYMERCITTWNDQVASRRRGISGRFMSLSKKWTGFSGSSRAISGGNLAAAGDSSNYNAAKGYYRPDSPEATMRRLADFAFMLRDYKLAHGVYDLLKTDFSNDKAWSHHAAAYEMSALAQLMPATLATTKAQLEAIDTALETACYSYLTRCRWKQETLRCMLLAAELFHASGSLGQPPAARWAAKIIEMELTGYIGTALLTERVAACFVIKTLNESGTVRNRRRKASFWSILASNAWIDLHLYSQAARCLHLASSVYKGLPDQSTTFTEFYDALGFVEDLRRVIRQVASTARHGDLIDVGDVKESVYVDEEREDLGPSNRRYSLINEKGASQRPGNDL